MDEELLGAYDTSSVSLRLPPSPTGEGFLVCPTVHLFFLTSIAFVHLFCVYDRPLTRLPSGALPEGEPSWGLPFEVLYHFLFLSFLDSFLRIFFKKILF